MTTWVALADRLLLLLHYIDTESVGKQRSLTDRSAPPRGLAEINTSLQPTRSTVRH